MADAVMSHMDLSCQIPAENDGELPQLAIGTLDLNTGRHPGPRTSRHWQDGALAATQPDSKLPPGKNCARAVDAIDAITPG